MTATVFSLFSLNGSIMASGPQFPPNQNPNPFGVNAQVPQPPVKSNSTAIILIILGVAFAGMLVCGGIMVALLLPAVSAARDAARRMQRTNQVKQIGLGLHNYQATYKTLPATVRTNAAGEEVLGWRVAISPFVDGERQWEQYDQNQAWDSPANSPLIAQAPPTYQALQATPGETHIFAIVSDNGMFVSTPNKATGFADVRDGLSNTVMAIELPDRGVEWTSTENLTPDEAYAAIKGLENRQVALLLMGDGSVLPIGNDLDRTTFDAMVTRAGNEQVFLPGR